MSLGTNISRLRAEKHLSQGDLAEALGVSRQSVSRWLNTEGWKEERAAREMSKESITSKTLSKLGDAIDKADGDERSIGRMADSLLKSVKAIKEINLSTTIVNKVDTLIEFENWMVTHRDEYPEIDDKMLVLINRMHSEFMGIKFKQK